METNKPRNIQAQKSSGVWQEFTKNKQTWLRKQKEPDPHGRQMRHRRERSQTQVSQIKHKERNEAQVRQGKYQKEKQSVDE